MDKRIDLTDLSQNELSNVIDEAKDVQQTRQDSRERELPTAADGSKGQDVHDPDHGVITAPTPREVKEEGPAHGAEKDLPQKGN